MESYVARASRADDIAVETVVLPESVLQTDVSSGAEGATRVAGAMFGTLVAAIVLGGLRQSRSGLNPVVRHGWYSSSAVSSSSPSVEGIHDITEFGLQVPTVAIAIGAGVTLTNRWRRDG